MFDRRPHVIVALLALALGLGSWASPALAQTDAAQSAAADRAEAWRAQLGQAHEMLKEKQYEAARDLTAALADDMVQNLGGGSEASYTMAVVAAFRAIAEVGLGHQDEGLWYWRIATTLHPAFAERDLGVYGDPALWLTQQPFRNGHQDPPAGNPLMEPSAEQAPAVELPGAIADLETDDLEVVAEVVIGRDGKPSEPRIVTAPEVPAVIYAVLDGIKHWTFQPATYDGKPVPMTHQVTVALGG